jgi:16S rRNA (guanine527-N7)-methyltransferase
MEMTLAPGIREAIDGHVRLLLAWNAAINLTSLRSPEQIARSHVLDSLIAVATLRELGPHASILDIGSGAGFPGLPLAMALSTRRAALVDSIGKKARFLGVAAAHAHRALEGAGHGAPDIHALARRAEDLAAQPDHREVWDLVTARAVGTVAEVAELGLPLVKRGGHVVCWKLDSGDGALRAEIVAARRICQAAGGGTPRIIRFAAADRVGLPGHCLVAIEKRRSSPDRYPRPAGERQRSP